MRPVARSNGSRQDPSPGRLAYRLERLRLTPGFRRCVRMGLPAAVLAAGMVFLAADEDTRQMVGSTTSGIRDAIMERPELTVRRIEISGASAELAVRIRMALPGDFPIGSLDLDLEEMRAALLALDPVAGADIRIRPGGVLQVSVQERLPALVWRGSRGIEILDREGHRTGFLIARAERPDLPLITGEGARRAAPEALELFAIAGTMVGRVRGLVRVGERRWDMSLDRGQRILLPENDPARALQRVIALDRARDLMSRDVTVIDMRLSHRPSVRLSDEAMAELRRIRGYSAGAGVQ